MTLTTFIEQLLKLESEGHGKKLVFYRHGSSGDCGELSSAHVTSSIDSDTGPFADDYDLGETGEYISIYAGH